MKKEVLYRLSRITIILCFLVLGTSIRTGIYENYEKSNDLREMLGANLKVVALKQNVTTYQKNKSYKMKITNFDNKSRTFTIALVNKNDNINEIIPYENIKYEIITNGKSVKKSTLNKNGHLYKTTLKKKETKVYEIKFSINENSKIDLKDKTFKSTIILI